MIDSEVQEQRHHRRLDVKLPLEYKRVDATAGPTNRTLTCNVSTGGLYFETSSGDLTLGDELHLHLSVPPNDNRFPSQAKISTVGRVVRTMCTKGLSDDTGTHFTRYGIAAQFQSPLKFSL